MCIRDSPQPPDPSAASGYQYSAVFGPHFYTDARVNGSCTACCQLWCRTSRGPSSISSTDQHLVACSAPATAFRCRCRPISCSFRLTATEPGLWSSTFETPVHLWRSHAATADLDALASATGGLNFVISLRDKSHANWEREQQAWPA